MKVLMSLLPTPGKSRLSACEAFDRLYYLLPVSRTKKCWDMCMTKVHLAACTVGFQVSTNIVKIKLSCQLLLSNV